MVTSGEVEVEHDYLLTRDFAVCTIVILLDNVLIFGTEAINCSATILILLLIVY